MNYRQMMFTILALLSPSIALTEDFQMINGKQYKNATISRVEPDGIVLKTKSGISKVYFTELPKDVQDRFHYHPAQASHFTADKEANMAQQNAASAGHPLGGTTDQFAARYGPPNDSPGLNKNFPLLQDAIHHTYAYQGWRIRAAFVPPDGPAVRMEYSKIVKADVNAVIQDYELQAIMTANTRSGTTWKEIMYNNPDSPNNGLSKIFEGYFMGAVVKRCGNAATARSYGCAANSLSVLSFLPRTNTKQNSKRKRNEKPANPFRSSDVK